MTKAFMILCNLITDQFFTFTRENVLVVSHQLRNIVHEKYSLMRKVVNEINVVSQNLKLVTLVQDFKALTCINSQLPIFKLQSDKYLCCP